MTTDFRTLATGIRRRVEQNQMQTEALRAVTSACKCNTSHQLLGTEEQARSARFYAVKYCGMDPVKLNIIAPVLHIIVSFVL